MTRAQDWLDGYIRAWRSYDEADVRAIFADDAEYWFRPNDPQPTRGIDAILEMWDSDRDDDPQHELEVLIEDDRLAIIKGHVSYDDKHYSNIWEVWFAPDGRAQKFVEWWMLPRKRDAG
ncbi:nuclear transport factor 2 family protein [Microbacterium rhizophilus]|uniref:nuclear transport factor 2 family protein n=1 Tax=Microbacterium rhizophilus TaxID=3138934 RepID=UPI0031EEB68B